MYAGGVVTQAALTAAARRYGIILVSVSVGGAGRDRSGDGGELRHGRRSGDRAGQDYRLRRSRNGERGAGAVVRHGRDRKARRAGDVGIGQDGGLAEHVRRRAQLTLHAQRRLANAPSHASAALSANYMCLNYLAETQRRPDTSKWV